jgi:mono/diheme cytochrome c family protein
MADRRVKKRRAIRIVIVLAVVLAAVAVVGWRKLFREVPQVLANDSMEERFKYGSIGSENDQGLPYWIWLVLPKMFPEYLPRPGGWASLGLAWEQGREVPIGFSKKTIGFDRVAINCAFCHTGRVRKAGETVPRIYPGGPGNAIDPLAYQRFLFACASDPRFTADNVLTEIAQVATLPYLDRLLYRLVLVPQTRRALLETKEGFAWTDTRVDWGRGRIDPFNPIKLGILKPGLYGDRPLAEIDDKTVGNSDMQPIWNMRPRVERKMALHWDGLNDDITEVVLSSALGDGASSKKLPIAPLKRLEEDLINLPSPRFEELYPVDHALAAAGEPIYRQHCARCHAMDGEKTGQVLPLTDEAWSEGVDPAAPRPRFTDNHRAFMWTPEAAKAYNAYADGRDWDFKAFRSSLTLSPSGGYVNVPLDGLWARAPYLHNGSVPYLAEVLEPPEKRTPFFYRGLDLYDEKRMGFVSEGDEAQRMGTPFDTTKEGNGNQGHFWGIQLAPQEKKALLEYLKTL